MTAAATTMSFEFQRSAPDLASRIVGFAERRDSGLLGPAVELPKQYALLQFILAGRYSVADAAESAWTLVPGAALWGATYAPCLGRHDAPLHVFVVILTHRAAGE